MNIAINGFGRIGRTFLRTIMQDVNASKRLSVACINIGPAKIEFVAHMFKYDTIMGTFDGNVSMRGDTLIINDHSIKIIAQPDAQKLNWKQFDVDWVVDASGRFTTRETASMHLDAGARSVLVTAPMEGDDVSIIPGINQEKYDPKKHKIVSLGSCTTNAFIPMLKVIQDNFGIIDGFMTTVHAYTNSQKLLDVEAKSLRLARAAALNIIPTTTGASKMLAKVLPELGDKIKSHALRVPVGIVSLINLTVNTKKEISVEMINKVFEHASSGSLQKIVALTYEPLVSSDFIKNSHSVIIDGLSTDAIGKNARILGWYDNEWGYSQRLKDFLMAIA